jgi:phage-related baseplate assembly protein
MKGKGGACTRTCNGNVREGVVLAPAYATAMGGKGAYAAHATAMGGVLLAPAHVTDMGGEGAYNCTCNSYGREGVVLAPAHATAVGGTGTYTAHAVGGEGWVGGRRCASGRPKKPLYNVSIFVESIEGLRSRAATVPNESNPRENRNTTPENTKFVDAGASGHQPQLVERGY